MTSRRPYRSPTLRRYVRCGVCGHYHADAPASAPSDPATTCGSECLNPACPECEKRLRTPPVESTPSDMAYAAAWTIAGVVVGYAVTCTGWGAAAGGVLGFMAFMSSIAIGR